MKTMIFKTLALGAVLFLMGCGTTEEWEKQGWWADIAVGDPELIATMEKSKGMHGEVLWIKPGPMIFLDCDKSTDIRGEGLCWYGFWDVVHYVLVIFEDRLLVAYIEDLYSGPVEFTVVEGSVIELEDIAAASASKSSGGFDVQVFGPGKQSLALKSSDKDFIQIIHEQTGLEVHGDWDEPAPAPYQMPRGSEKRW